MFRLCGVLEEGGFVRYCLIILLLVYSVYGLHGTRIGSSVQWTTSIRDLSTTVIEEFYGSDNATFVNSFLDDRGTNSGPFIAYYDQQQSTSLRINYNGNWYIFVLVQCWDPVSRYNQIWAVTSSHLGNRRIAIQITDFGPTGAGGGTKIDRSVALAKDRGIYFVRSREEYTTKSNTATYSTGDDINVVYAININELLWDVLDIEIGASTATITATDYFTIVSRLPFQSDWYNCGWGMVYDNIRDSLYIATTNMHSVPQNTELAGTPGAPNAPTENFLYCIDASTGVNFSANEISLPTSRVLQESTEDIKLSHLMINPFNPSLLAIDNYAGLTNSDGIEDNVFSGPSTITIFDFTITNQYPQIKHLVLPFTYAKPNRLTHMSFVGPNHMTFSRSIDAVKVREGYVADISNMVSLNGTHHFVNNFFRFDKKSVGTAKVGIPHCAMSRNGKFIISDRGDSAGALNTLFLWYARNGEMHCIEVVDDINQLDMGATDVHPHASFIDDENGDNRLIIYNGEDRTPIDKMGVWITSIPDVLWNDRANLDDLRTLTKDNSWYNYSSFQVQYQF